jgi:hypothetical protein
MGKMDNVLLAAALYQTVAAKQSASLRCAFNARVLTAALIVRGIANKTSLVDRLFTSKPGAFHASIQAFLSMIGLHRST